MNNNSTISTIDKHKLTEFCKKTLGSDFVVTRVEMLRHLPYVENETYRRYHELLAKKNGTTTSLSDTEKNELNILGSRLETKTLDETLQSVKNLSAVYSNAIDVILRGGVTFFDNGNNSSKRVQKTVHALLENSTARTLGTYHPDVRNIELPQSDKNIDFGDSNTNNSAAFTKAWKEVITPLRGKVRHILLISNRSYASHFATSTEQPETGLQAQEKVFEEQGGFLADYGEKDGQSGIARLVKDKICVRTRSDIQPFLQVPVFVNLVQKQFPDVTAASLADMDVVDFQNLANAIVRSDYREILELAGCVVPELNLVALRAALGVGPFSGTNIDLAVAKKSFLSLAKNNDSLRAVEPVLQELFSAGTAARFALQFAGEVRSNRGKLLNTLFEAAAAGSERGACAALHEFYGLLAVVHEADAVFSKSLDARISGKQPTVPTNWPLGGYNRPTFIISDDRGHEVFNSTVATGEEKIPNILKILLTQPSVTILEAEGGLGKSLLLAEAARAWLLSGATQEPLGRIGYISLSGEIIDSEGRVLKIEQALKTCDTLLLDSLDEAIWHDRNDTTHLQEKREKFSQALRTLASGNKRILVASRPGYFPGDAHRFQLQGLSDKTAHDFVQNYITSTTVPGNKQVWLDDWKTLLHTAQKNEVLGKTIHNPLMILLLCQAVVREHRAGDKTKTFSWYAQHVGHLFEDIVVQILERWESEKTRAPLNASRKGARLQGLMDGLSQAAFFMGYGYELNEKSAAYFLSDTCRAQLPSKGEDDQGKIQIDLSPLCVLVPSGEQGGVRFLHETMREYFAARHVKKMIHISKKYVHTGFVTPLKTSNTTRAIGKFVLEDIPSPVLEPGSSPAFMDVPVSPVVTTWLREKMEDFRQYVASRGKEEEQIILRRKGISHIPDGIEGEKIRMEIEQWRVSSLCHLASDYPREIIQILPSLDLPPDAITEVLTLAGQYADAQDVLRIAQNVPAQGEALVDLLTSIVKNEHGLEALFLAEKRYQEGRLSKDELVEVLVAGAQGLGATIALNICQNQKIPTLHLYQLFEKTVKTHPEATYAACKALGEPDYRIENFKNAQKTKQNFNQKKSPHITAQEQIQLALSGSESKAYQETLLLNAARFLPQETALAAVQLGLSKINLRIILKHAAANGHADWAARFAAKNLDEYGVLDVLKYTTTHGAVATSVEVAKATGRDPEDIARLLWEGRFADPDTVYRIAIEMLWSVPETKYLWCASTLIETCLCTKLLQNGLGLPWYSDRFQRPLEANDAHVLLGTHFGIFDDALVAHIQERLQRKPVQK